MDWNDITINNPLQNYDTRDAGYTVLNIDWSEKLNTQNDTLTNTLTSLERACRLHNSMTGFV